MKIKNNKKGFTLVELLAVIVVLAVIMVIAVPSVLTQMNTAKQKSFQMWAEKMLSNAMIVYESQSLIGDFTDAKKTSDGKICYSYKDLGLKGAGDYRGYIVVDRSTTIGVETTYTVYLADQTYAYDGVLSSEVYNNLKAIKADKTTVSKLYEDIPKNTCYETALT